MKRSRRWSFFKSQAKVRERERETVESVAILGFLPHRSISDFSLSLGNLRFGITGDFYFQKLFF